MRKTFLVSTRAPAFLIAVVSLASISVVSQAQTAVTKTWTPPRTPWGDPDLQGIWNNSTTTPLERPSQFAGKEVLTDEEVANLNERNTNRGKSIGRTSLIVDPPDGRIPLTAEAQKKRAAGAEYRRAHPADSWEDLPLYTRCIVRGGLPNLPTRVNNNYQILQTPGYVVILQEIMHDTRIVPLDGRPHLGRNISQWSGDSRGRWEGNTLVVDTTNFSPKIDPTVTRFRGSGETFHLVERFTRIDANNIDYRFTIEDPKSFTRPWTAMLPMRKTQDPIYEYACHEGNYPMVNILRGYRADEKAAEEAAKKGLR